MADVRDKTQGQNLLGQLASKNSTLADMNIHRIEQQSSEISSHLENVFCVTEISTTTSDHQTKDEADIDFEICGVNHSYQVLTQFPNSSSGVSDVLSELPDLTLQTFSTTEEHMTAQIYTDSSESEVVDLLQDGDDKHLDNESFVNISLSNVHTEISCDSLSELCRENSDCHFAQNGKVNFHGTDGVYATNRFDNNVPDESQKEADYSGLEGLTLRQVSESGDVDILIGRQQNYSAESESTDTTVLIEASVDVSDRNINVSNWDMGVKEVSSGNIFGDKQSSEGASVISDSDNSDDRCDESMQENTDKEKMSGATVTVSSSKCTSEISRATQKEKKSKSKSKAAKRRKKQQEKLNNLIAKSVTVDKNKSKFARTIQELRRQPANYVDPDLVNIDSSLTCSVCLELYYRPHRCQPCDHVFCDPCLRKLACRMSEGVHCPLCRTVIQSCVYDKELDFESVNTHHDVYYSRDKVEKHAKTRHYPLPFTPTSPLTDRLLRHLLASRASQSEALGRSHGQYGYLYTVLRLLVCLVAGMGMSFLFVYLYIYTDSASTSDMVRFTNRAFLTILLGAAITFVFYKILPQDLFHQR